MKNLTRICLLSAFLLWGGLEVLLAQPVNDLCSGAVAVGALPYTSAAYDVTLATTTGDPGIPTCQSDVARSIWFTFTPGSTGNYYLSTCQSDAPGSTLPDCILSVYTSGGGCSGPFTSVACNDDGCTTLNFQSVIPSVALTAGTTYYLVAWQYCSAPCAAPAAGSASIQLYIEAAPPSLPNDACATATDLGSAATTVAGSNVGAIDEGAIGYASCDFSIGGLNDVWYKFTTNAVGGDVTVTVNANTVDAVLAVYSGCSDLGELDCSDSPAAADPEVVSLTGLTPNTVYYARVTGYDGDEGTFNISIAGTALPLELKSFTGQSQATTNVLSWETLTEKNVQSHIVERSLDGLRWSEVGRLAGKNDSQVSVKYSLEDRAPLAKAYYRLRSVDFDGKESLSSSIVLTRKGDHFAITSVFPSPTTDNVTVQFNATTEEKVTIRVMDMTGRLVMEQYVEAVKDINELPVTLNGLQAGVYTVTVSNSTGVSAPVRFVKQ